MTLATPLSRRRTIAAAITALAGIVWPGSLRALQLRHSSALTGALTGYRPLARLCADLRCADTISQACLRAVPPNESSSQALASLILDGIPWTSRVRLSAGTLRDAIRDRSRRDFGAGDIVVVDGWVLSRTEVRLYALAALFGRPQIG